MEQLPFKVRKKNPEVIYVGNNTDVPEVVRKDRMGADAATYKGKIYLFKKNVPKSTMEHEVAHTMIVQDKTKSPKGVVSWLDDEVKADIYTWHKYGFPSSIYNNLHARARDVNVYHMSNEKYNHYEHTKHTLEHMDRVYKKYWEYIPEQWKKDYLKFSAYGNRMLSKWQRLGKNTNPSGDYFLRKNRIGEWKTVNKKVVRKRDKITGFIVKGVK